MGSHIFLLSRKREVKVAHSDNKTTRCRNCQRDGHTAPVCKYSHPVCPICALHHKKSEHRCPNPTCPKEGNVRPVAACCSASPPHCTNCGDDHPATDPACPARPKRPQNDPPPPDHAPAHPLPEEGEIDTTEDEGEIAETPHPPAPLLPPQPAGSSPPSRWLPPALLAPLLLPLSFVLLQALPARSPRRPPAPLPPQMMTWAWPANVVQLPSLSPTTGWWGLPFSLHRTTQQSSSAKKILPHVLHTYLPVWSSNTTSPYPSYPSCIHIMF